MKINFDTNYRTAPTTIYTKSCPNICKSYSLGNLEAQKTGLQFIREGYLKLNNINFNGKNFPLLENQPLQERNRSSNISFSGVECSTQNFPMKKVYELECPCCGQTMLTKKQVDAYTLRTCNETGDNLIKELEKGLPYYRNTERTIVQELSEVAKDFPEANLHELVCLQAINSKSELEAAQKAVLSEMRMEAQKLPEEQKEQVERVISEAEYSIDFSDDEQHFHRREFIESIEKICDKYEDYESKRLRRICKRAEEIPSSQTSKDAFYVKYKRRDNEAIARRLVLPAIVTTEHVRAHSDGGENNTSNYIPMCGDCNSRRGNMPYDRWFVIHPEMPSNLQKYLDTVVQMMETGALEDEEYLSTYVDEVIEAVFRATKGKLKLEKPDPKSYALEQKTESMRQDLIIVKNKIAVSSRKLQNLMRTKARLNMDEEYQRIYNIIQAGGREAVAAFSEPQIIQAEINEKQKILKRQETLTKRIDTLQKETLPKEELAAQMAKSSNQIGDLKIQIEDLEADFIPNSKEAQEEIKKYQTCQLKYDMLSRVNTNIFRDAFASEDRKNIDPSFILYDEKSKLKTELEQYCDMPSIRHFLLSGQLEKAEEMREILRKKQAANNEKINELKASQIELEGLNCDEKTLRSEINLLKSKKRSAMYRIKNINIDKDIARLEDELKELTKEQEDIENKLNLPN